MYKATFSEMFEILGYMEPTPEELEEIRLESEIADKEWDEQIRRWNRNLAARQKRIAEE